MYCNFKLDQPPELWEAWRTIDEHGVVIAWQHQPRTNCTEDDYGHSLPGKTKYLGKIENYQGNKQQIKISKNLLFDIIKG